MRKRVLSLLLCLCLLIHLFVGFAVLAEEKATLTGTVHVSDTLRVRNAPGTNGTTVVGYLYNNDVVTIHETVLDSNGGKWYHITKGSITGYASADYITVNASYENDEQFEAYLTAQGFPEDYKVRLREIHAQYPNWIFQARHLSMSWATALAAESEVGLNTITKPDAWKSMEYGAYNWTTNSYVAYDSGGWVTAAPSLIAYYMDPRNFLDSTYIFQFEKLTFSTAHTVDGIKAILPTALDIHAEALLEAAKLSNVSAYFLAARMTQEGSHINGLGLGTVPGYEGYYNFFHIGAYAANGNNAVTNGAIYAKNQGWDTPLKCIKASADRIARGYINIGQDTNYFQKFNVTNTQSGLYSHQYMSNTEAAASEGRIRRNAASTEELKNALVFSIPVYKDMPTAIAPLPGKTGNNNNFLDSITASVGELTPTFDRYTMHYAMQVGKDVAAVKIDAAVNDKNAVLSGTGDVFLQPGVNTVKLTVKATSGEIRTYTLTITREGGGSTTGPSVGDSTTGSTGDSTTGTTTPLAPIVNSTKYTIASTVTKVEPNTTVESFLQSVQVTNGTAAVYTAGGQAKATGILATGDVLQIFSGTTLHTSYPVIIIGDINGDGQITSLDLRIAQKHILGAAALQGHYLTAADSSKDGALTSLDLRIAQKYILGMTQTLQ